MAITAGLGGQPAEAVALIDRDTGDALDLFSLAGAKAAAVAVVDASGNQITSFGGASASLQAAPLQVTASGDTALVAVGTRRLRRVEASNSHASTAVVAGLKVASIASGAVFGKKYLPAAGGLAVWVFPDGYLQITAEALVANLSAAGQVEFTAYYE